MRAFHLSISPLSGIFVEFLSAAGFAALNLYTPRENPHSIFLQLKSRVDQSPAFGRWRFELTDGLQQRSGIWRPALDVGV